MNSFQHALSSVMEEQSNGLEIVAVSKNKVSVIYKNKIYQNYNELPLPARYSIAKAITKYSPAYNMLRKSYSVLEAEERMCWCLFGSFDSTVDINIFPTKANIEISTHCAKCQYEKPFCYRELKPLTHREQQCFILMRSGYTDKEIAAKLGIAYTTVVKHVYQAVSKFSDKVGRQVTRAYILTALQEAGV
ncbi:MAG: helix-turn-helix transcriptional regulator [Bacteroidales bacterium]